MELDAEATGQPPNAPSPLRRLRRLGSIGLGASIVLHGLFLSVLRCGGGDRTPAPRTIDIETVPIAPAAEALAPEEALPPPPVAPPPVAEPAALPPPEPASEVIAALDAGVDAEQVVAIDAGVDAEQVVAIDAGVDAEQVVAVDAGVDADQVAVADDGEAVAAADAGLDGEQVAVVDDGGLVPLPETVANAEAGDGGAELVASADGDAGIIARDPDPAGDPAARPSSGTRADLIRYYPPGHVVSVLIRLDRLRGTEWADHINSVLRPLPDSAALLGGADVKLTDQFEMLSFSSSQPQNVLDTIVVAHTAMPPAALRDFLDSPEAPVSWSAARGGALGRREPSRLMFPGDPRVFLLWQPGWGVLARPGDLAGLTAAAAGALDQVAAAPAELPPWLAQISSIEDESGHPTGPAIMVTAAHMFPARIALPIGGVALPGPDSATVTLELDPAGFIVKGNLRYSDEATAIGATAAITQVRAEVLDDTMVSLLLRQVRAYNAIHGLSVKRTGRRVAFATSISTADGHALMAFAARMIEGYFSRRPSATAAP